LFGRLLTSGRTQHGVLKHRSALENECFVGLLNDLLYHRAVTTDDTVRGDMVKGVLLRHLVTSLKLMLDHGLSPHQKLGQYWEDDSMLHFLCTHGDDEHSVPLARLLIERGADIEAKDPQNAETMLHVASRKGARGLAELLLAWC
jgi:ankyrin repeat protein